MNKNAFKYEDWKKINLKLNRNKTKYLIKDFFCIVLFLCLITIFLLFLS